MLKKLKQFTLQLIAGANVATIVLMLLVGYSDRLEPASFPMLATVGLAFPVLLAINVAFLVFWLLVKARYALIPVAGLLVGYQPVRTYFPLNLPRSTDSTLTVVSFNAYDVNHMGQKEFRPQVADYLDSQKADIVCLQEFSMNAEAYELLTQHYDYIDTSHVSRHGEALTLLSKYPIVGKEKLYTASHDDKQKVARSVVFYVVIDQDTVAVVNNHLASTQLTEGERSSFRRIVKGDLKRDSAEHESKRLIKRLSKSILLREPQVATVAASLDSLLRVGRSVLLCGDFNDGPISFAHQQVARRLTDCYREGGNGPGISYHENGLYVRIDHVFCSADWEPRYAKVDSKMSISDHYPVICRLKKRLKP